MSTLAEKRHLGVFLNARGARPDLPVMLTFFRQYDIKVASFWTQCNVWP